MTAEQRERRACDGTGSVYLDSDGDECSADDAVREVPCPHCGRWSS